MVGVGAPIIPLEPTHDREFYYCVHLHVRLVSHTTAAALVLSAAEDIPDQGLPVIELLRIGAQTAAVVESRHGA